MLPGVSFETVYKQYCRTGPPLTALLHDPVEKVVCIDGQQNKKQLLSCGYCNVRCTAVPGLVKHCQGNRHKHEVFADSGRDVLWHFEPPPLEKNKISTTLHR